MTSQKTIVFPGDAVAIAEEFLPGPGTYEENGEVFAATIGELELDANEFVARVRAFPEELSVIKIGDTILGKIHMMRSTMAVVEAQAIADKPGRAIGGDTNGTLYIGKVADFFVTSVEDLFRLGDVIRAGVEQVTPSLQLTTKGPKLGVLKRWCPRCRTIMEKRGDALVCPECDWKDTGKIAADYGVGNLVYEGPEPEPERGPGRGGGRERGFGDRRGGGRGFGGERRGGRDDRRGGDRRGGREGRDDRRGRGGFREERRDERRPREDRGPREGPREDRPREYREDREPRERGERRGREEREPRGERREPRFEGEGERVRRDEPRESREPREERAPREPRESREQRAPSEGAPAGESGQKKRRRRGRRGGRGRRREGAGGGSGESGGDGGEE